MKLSESEPGIRAAQPAAGGTWEAELRSRGNQGGWFHLPFLLSYRIRTLLGKPSEGMITKRVESKTLCIAIDPGDRVASIGPNEDIVE